ncbi:MAG: YjjG family noncanonical pyrimidine nucleotidase [Bacteroidetes bacterium]|nr:YjjG family noncanonical pyrimidine nucleotidase [Bacteroidota bacterium]
MKYRCLLFDLDHTLWDYETNSREALTDLFREYQLQEKGIDNREFINTFEKINNEMWDLYDRGLLHRDAIRNERFHKILLTHSIDDYGLSLRISHDYLIHSPKKKNLMEGCREILDYLFPKYPMVIVTNGFDEIQSTKLSSSGITHYFKDVITSARAGFKKPAKEIFEFALQQNGFSAPDALMIGDNLLTDMAGAQNAHIDTVYFNPMNLKHNSPVTFEIGKLTQLKQLL